MIELMHGELKKLSSSDFYVMPNIPPAKLRNAIDNYPVPADEQVLALVDATVFGSAKNGMVFGHTGVYWKNDWTTESAKTFLTWAEIAAMTGTMTAKGNVLHLSRDCVLNLAGSQVKAAALLSVFQRIDQSVRSRASAMPHDTLSGVAFFPPLLDEAVHAPAAPQPASQTTPPAPHFAGAYDRNLLDIVQAVAKRHRLAKSVYIAPAIQMGRVKTILEICGNDIDPYSILAVVDNTFLQTCKDFLIVTDKEIIAKGTLRKVDRFALSELRHIYSTASTFYVNNHDFQCFDQLSDSEIVILCDFLLELVPALKQAQQSDTGLEQALAAAFDEAFGQAKTRLQTQLGTARESLVHDRVETLIGVL